jgi:hypothetical protein
MLPTRRREVASPSDSSQLASISASSRTTRRRASGHIVKKSIRSAVVVAVVHQREEIASRSICSRDGDAREVVACLGIELLEHGLEVGVAAPRHHRPNWITAKIASKPTTT